MKISILTLFPESFEGFLKDPVLVRAGRQNALTIQIVDIRKYAEGSFRQLDDNTFGGGTGQVMRAKPVLLALDDVRKKAPGTLTAALTPSGIPYTQSLAKKLSSFSHLVLICGHYEGMDERIYRAVDMRISIGDYILTGGELAAQVVANSCIRLLPGILKDGVTDNESFEGGLLEYPQYTQPADLDGDRVPDVLLSGNHERIRRWRLKEALRTTYRYRPDLLLGRTFTDEEKVLLSEVKKEEDIDKKDLS